MLHRRQPGARWTRDAGPVSSAYVYRYRPGWLFAAVIGLVVLAVMFGALLATDGIELRSLAWFICIAVWCLIYGRQRSYQVTVDEDTITFRRVLGRRTRPMGDLTRVVPSSKELLLFTFGKRGERVFRGEGADELLDHVRRLNPSLRDPLNPPEFTIVLRGYDRTAVDDFIDQRRARAGDEPATAAPPAFPIVWRGYEKTQVDAYLGVPEPSTTDQPG